MRIRLFTPDLSMLPEDLHHHLSQHLSADDLVEALL